MKECYFCHNEIPEDSKVCPMCGSDLTQVENTEQTAETEEVLRYVVKPEDYIKSEAGSPRRSKKGVHFGGILNAAANYLSFNAKRILHPVQNTNRSERNSIYGYLNLLLASLLSASILTRMAFALDRSYQLLTQISILPTMTFRFNVLEWLWKLSIFFFAYFILLPFLVYLIRKITKKEPFAFHNWITQFVGMNSFFYLLLWIAFFVSLAAPLSMALPIMLILVLHCLSYLAAFVSSLHQQLQEGIDRNKIFQQTLLGISLHFILVSGLALVLFKI